MARQGSYEQVLIWKEVTRGTQPGTLAGHKMPLYDYGAGLFEQALADVYELNGTPQPGQPGRSVIEFSGPLTVPVDEVAVGLWLQLMLSSVSVAGAGDPYSHTFKVNTSDPDSFGMEFGNTAAAKYDKYPGCALRSMSFDINKGAGKATMSLDVIGCIAGAPTREGGASVDAAPDTYTSDRYNLFPSIFKIGGSASTLVERVTFTIAREVAADHVLDGNRYAAHCSFGAISVEGQITGIRDTSDTLYDLAMSTAGAEGSEQTLEVDLTGMNSNRDLKFYFDECAVFVPSAPGLGGRGNQRITLGFKAYYGNDADASAVRAVLRNGLSAYSTIWTASA